VVHDGRPPNVVSPSVDCFWANHKISLWCNLESQKTMCRSE